MISSTSSQNISPISQTRNLDSPNIISTGMSGTVSDILNRTLTPKTSGVVSPLLTSRVSPLLRSVVAKLDRIHEETYPDGSTYTGEWKDGKREGQGLFIAAVGDRYEGTWQDDLFHGDGKLIDAAGFIYEGQWERNCPHGKGVSVSPDGTIIHGTFCNGVLHGSAKWVSHLGDTWEGEWVNGYFRNGKGIICVEEGVRYEGDIREGVQWGQGQEVSPHGVYEGEWVNGRPSGQGEMKYADGGVYKGEWVDGCWQGDGRLTNIDGTVTEGQFQYAYANGRATQTGSLLGRQYRFIGNFVNGLRDGWGIFEIGPVVIEGTWSQGALEGHAEAKNTISNRKYEGEFHRGLRHGPGVSTLTDGSKIDQCYSNGMEIPGYFKREFF